MSDSFLAIDLPPLKGIVTLSLAVSLSATALAAMLALPSGAALAVYSFRLRRPLIVAINGLLGLPPVVAGLALYLLLSHSGPLGMLDLLFTPIAMVLAQAMLAFPIITALTHRGIEEAWMDYGDALMDLGASRRRALPVLLAIRRNQVLTAILAGFGRSISEVGAILIVGGNIAFHTRTMTTAIALETSEGNLSSALALGLVLIVISFLVSLIAFMVAERGRG